MSLRPICNPDRAAAHRCSIEQPFNRRCGGRRPAGRGEASRDAGGLGMAGQCCLDEPGEPPDRQLRGRQPGARAADLDPTSDLELVTTKRNGRKGSHELKLVVALRHRKAG
jgi:hypothetical protein